MSGLLVGCDANSRDERAQKHARQESVEIDERNRRWQEMRQRKLATVERYRGWFARVAKIDHAALGLPQPEPLPDGSIPPATASETFCERLAALPNQAPRPTAEQWSRAYREQVARWRVAHFPQSYEEYRALYLSERQLARLACIARDGGPALRQALLAPLARPASASAVQAEDGANADIVLEPGFESSYISPGDVDESVYYTAAVYAIKHGLDPDGGWNALRAIRDGESTYKFSAKAKFDENPPPLSLGCDADHEYVVALWWLRENRQPPKRLRAGQTRSVLP
ncbi:hypothetical protein [Haliangium sp.]|uniref:hypothetical protein n=1 Tax=Haliangium sp. TaxID=2663208 RepID=UPI003D10A50D